MSDREGEMTGALRAAIREMEKGLSGVEAAYLEFMAALTKGAAESRCRAVWVFDRLKLNFEYSPPPRAGVVYENEHFRVVCDASNNPPDSLGRHEVNVSIDLTPLDEVERDGD